MQFSVIFVVFALAVPSCFAAIPSDIPLCKVKDLTCIADITTRILNGNPNGKPDLGLPSLEPLKIKSATLNQGQNGPVNLQFTFKDLDVLGISSAKVEKTVGFEEDPKTSKFEMYATVPKLTLKGKYKVGGRILVLPIEGEGDGLITFEQLKVSAKFKPSVEEKNGKQHIQVDKFKLLLEPAKMTFKLDNLFNGDKTLGDNMNTFLNENWKDVWTELSPATSDVMSSLLGNIINSIFKVTTYDEIYKKD